ncbi:hypothetical protein F511_22464 [Dorcoceras hygrometricum]|uniref:Uncharacterized protein n=1 Tax=Dorcoceras hygrometricum TaxID=472368 RepID=A0A2Z7D732_9LAMI|nr:hypothetical protein F511_22464 [Dorcoceras hygrometricum]
MPRGRSRARRQVPVESWAQNLEDDVGQTSVPVCRHVRQVDDEVDLLASRVDEMEFILVRFERMNPQTFMGAETSADAETWLEHIEGLFDRVHYDDACKLSLDTFQLRKNAHRWWRGASRAMTEMGVEYHGVVSVPRPDRNSSRSCTLPPSSTSFTDWYRET